MNSIYLKYNHLDMKLKKEVDMFIDFLLSKKQIKEKKSDLKYQKDLLKISQWSEDDILKIEDAKSAFNSLNKVSW